MHSTHAILVNTTYAAHAADKSLSDMTKEEITEMVIDYATEETERYSGLAFDSRTLLDENIADDDYRPVIYAKEDWEAFEEVLLSIDKAQKWYAKHMLEYLILNTGTYDVSEILNNLLLANDRTANKDDVDPDAWKWDFLNQGSWALREIARLCHGEYYFESEFYDTSRGTALVPFIEKLKEHPEEWVLVRFDYHW